MVGDSNDQKATDKNVCSCSVAAFGDSRLCRSKYSDYARFCVLRSRGFGAEGRDGCDPEWRHRGCWRKSARSEGGQTISCEGCVVLAGFWNAHVHFMESKWNDAAHQPAEELARQMAEMLNHSGFTTVLDTRM